jgi:hypothetical protein
LPAEQHRSGSTTGFIAKRYRLPAEQHRLSAHCSMTIYSTRRVFPFLLCSLLSGRTRKLISVSRFCCCTSWEHFWHRYENENGSMVFSAALEICENASFRPGQKLMSVGTSVNSTLFNDPCSGIGNVIGFHNRWKPITL